MSKHVKHTHQLGSPSEWVNGSVGVQVVLSPQGEQLTSGYDYMKV